MEDRQAAAPRAPLLLVGLRADGEPPLSGHVDVDAVEDAGFGLSEDYAEPFATGWHAHARHQLLYAAWGTLRLEVDDAQWLLPPQRAAWIAAGVRHRVAARRPVALRTVYLDEALVPAAPEGCRVFGVAALAREMTLEAMRWGPGAASGEVARRFFAALAALAAQWAAVPGRFVLPRAKTAELERAMAFVLERLEGGEAPSLDEAAAAAGVSRRTLTRRFRHEARTSFVGFVRAARMMRAMELLDRPGARVTEVAYDVGFESLGAFTRAFEAFVGELPSDYRRRAAEASTSP